MTAKALSRSPLLGPVSVTFSRKTKPISLTRKDYRLWSVKFHRLFNLEDLGSKLEERAGIGATFFLF